MGTVVSDKPWQDHDETNNTLSLQVILKHILDVKIDEMKRKAETVNARDQFNHYGQAWWDTCHAFFDLLLSNNGVFIYNLIKLWKYMQEILQSIFMEILRLLQIHIVDISYINIAMAMDQVMKICREKY